MARLIDIIKKNLTQARGSSSKDEPLKVSHPTVQQASEQRILDDGPAPVRGSNFRRSSSQPVNALPIDHERAEQLKALYHELYAVVQMALGQAIHRDKVESVVWRVVEAFEADPYSHLLLLSYSFSRKSYLPAHIVNDVILTVGFARSLGFSRDDMKDLGISAFCHDLGMSNFEGIAKKGQQLSDQEIEDIKQHPMRSAELIRPIFSEKIASVVLDVHERDNGQGYPRGIPGADIHLWAKVISICDSFEALTHPRIFRLPYSPYEAIKIIIKKKDVLFSDEIVRRFIDFLSIYPVGSLVRLNSGEIGLVVAANVGLTTRPVIRIVVRENREIDESGTMLDLGKEDFLYVTGVLEPEKERELLQYQKPRGEVELDEA